MISSFGDDMNFWERLGNTLGDVFFTLFVDMPRMTSFSDPERKIDFYVSYTATFNYVKPLNEMVIPQKIKFSGNVSPRTFHVYEFQSIS